ncbi:YwhD family protein [Domibacillus sp. DTU_2020_1001157_1_SI_ALB_TIR_016]|uniref:YwhD family protein n=1 Tax=Domibacillus sp. DTU_2020_1001157_1_SI_ALB_TIR_016 TaxID=3077789 RepID=UPI0028EAD22C|nr:YwhD family protein [Domibacillus sp. DTU_2020_1001157_1_SI_ALB_TIR_016]WNS81084.1 YwhD family protein [Domibacillus sp. DTU_2020_1001157_1_SI_ALB_TIR_016]
MEQKKKVGFNIIKNDPTDGHKGFGKGALSLEEVSPVIIDVEEGSAHIDIGAMHARSAVEKGIKFLKTKEEVPDAKPYWLVWVTVDRKEEGPYYAGVTACEMTVNRDIRRGYKSLPEHVNRMDKSLKRHIIVDVMDDRSKTILRDFLTSHNEQMWNLSSDELKNGLTVTEA